MYLHCFWSFCWPVRVRRIGAGPAHRLNIDYGQQSQEGANARVAGNLANSQDCANGPHGKWELKTLTTQGQTMIVPTDPEGTLWLFAGTDSAFEGLTQYYITTLRARLEPYETEVP